jgi:hypothetical protein
MRKLYNEQIKENEMGCACSIYRGDEKCIENVKGRNHAGI